MSNQLVSNKTQAFLELVRQLKAFCEKPNRIAKTGILCCFVRKQNISISDFDCYCLAAKYRQYQLVILVDDEGDLWAGCEDEILKQNYFRSYRSYIAKIYR